MVPSGDVTSGKHRRQSETWKPGRDISQPVAQQGQTRLKPHFTFISTLGKILPPQNVSLKWITDIQIELSWTPPPHMLENCQYVVTKITKDGKEVSMPHLSSCFGATTVKG